MTGDASRIAVTYVTAGPCHLCDHGRHVLTQLAASYPLDIREVALTHPEGCRRWPPGGHRSRPCC